MSQKEPEGLQPKVGDGPAPGGPGRDPGEPPRGDPDRPQPALDSRPSRFLASVAAAVEGLRQRVQELISRINEGREDDHSALSGFRSSLLLQVSALAEQLEERLFQLYALHNERIQQRLRALGELLERLERAQDELRRVCGSVEEAWRELCLRDEP